MSTVTPSKETKVVLTIGDTKVEAVLNDSTTAKDLLSKLPYTVRLNRYEFDYCGIIQQPLNFDESDMHNGWKDGDICLAGDYFTILFAGQEQSESHSGLITIGRIENNLSLIEKLGRAIEVTVDVQ